MQLPLRAVQEHSETLIADDEHVIVAVMHSSDCLVNADVLVTAVNERAADKAEIERLRKALLQTDRVVTTMANRLQAMTTARKSDIAGHLQQAREYLTVYFDDYPCVLLGELRAALDAGQNGLSPPPRSGGISAARHSQKGGMAWAIA